MAHKTLYVSAADDSLWAAAQRVADRKNTSLSRIVADALRNDLPRAAADIATPPRDEWAHIATDAPPAAPQPADASYR